MFLCLISFAVLNAYELITGAGDWTIESIAKMYVVCGLPVLTHLVNILYAYSHLCVCMSPGMYIQQLLRQSAAMQLLASTRPFRCGTAKQAFNLVYIECNCMPM